MSGHLAVAPGVAARPAVAPGHAFPASSSRASASRAGVAPSPRRGPLGSNFRPSHAPAHRLARTSRVDISDAEGESATSEVEGSAHPAPTQYKNSLVYRKEATGPRKVFFEETYDITIREYKPYAVKVDVQSNGISFRVTVETDSAADLVLHWGVATAQMPDVWLMPPSAIMPAGTTELAEVCQTPLVKEMDADGKSVARVVIEGDIEYAPHALNFVLHDRKYNQWYHCPPHNDFFRVACPALPEPEPEPEAALEAALEKPMDAAKMEALERQIAEKAAAAKVEDAEPKEPKKSRSFGALGSLLQSMKPKERPKPAEEEKVEEEEKEEEDEEGSYDDDDYVVDEKERESPKSQASVAALLQNKSKERKRPRIGLFGLRLQRDKKTEEPAEPEPGAIVAETEDSSAEEEKVAEDSSSSSSSSSSAAAASPAATSSEPEPPVEVDWFCFHEQSHTVFTEVDVPMRVGIRVDMESDAPTALSRVRVETDLPSKNLLLHWGVVPRGARKDMWTCPPPPMRPAGSKVHDDKALQTPMTVTSGGLGGEFAYVELEMSKAPGGLRFVFKEDGGRNRWFDNDGADFVVPLPQAALSSSLISPPAGRVGVPLEKKTSETLEAAQMALGGAAAATFGVGKENVDAYAEELILLASTAYEAAVEATRLSEQATAAAKGLPEDGVISTKARRLIAQAEQARERARVAAQTAEACALRVKAARDPDSDAAKLAEKMALEATQAAEMAAQTWAGEHTEISEAALKRWREDMELMVTKEAQNRAEAAQREAREMRDQMAKARAERVAAETAAAEKAMKEAEERRAAAEEADRIAAEAAAAADLAARIDAASAAAAAPSPPEWLTDPSTVKRSEPAIPTDAVFTTGAPPLPDVKKSSDVLATPPAPAVTPSAPAVTPVAPPAATPPGEKTQMPTGDGREILIQGFNWESARHKPGPWYRRVTELAPRLAECGFTVIWLPPPTHSVSDEGYMPGDLYDLNSKYGSVEDLRECVATLHSHGIKCLGDAVLNHRCAQFQGPEGLWNQYGGKLNWDARAIVSDDPHFGGRGNPSCGDFFHAAPNIDHSQDFVQRDIAEWMRWLQTEVGYDGWRLDYVRGFSGVYVKKYMEATDVHFGVGEYWDTLSYDYDTPNHDQNDHRKRIINWIDDAGGTSGAFDVTTKGIMHAVFERQEYWRLCDSEGRPPGVVGLWPSRAVTFIENHDTGSTQGHWRFPEGFETQGYVYILTHPGTPTVFWDHLFEWHDTSLGDTIVRLMEIRKAFGIHSRSAVKILRAEPSFYAAQIDESLVMKIGAGDFSPDEGAWEYYTHGMEWCLWKRRDA